MIDNIAIQQLHDHCAILNAKDFVRASGDWFVVVKGADQKSRIIRQSERAKAVAS